MRVNTALIKLEDYLFSHLESANPYARNKHIVRILSTLGELRQGPYGSHLDTSCTSSVEGLMTKILALRFVRTDVWLYPPSRLTLPS